MIDRKAAIRDYKLSHRPMGVLQIRNTENGKVWVDSSNNIPGKFNRHRLQLNAGTHVSRPLQEDWNAFGEDAFEFETLEELEPLEAPDYDYSEDLEALKELWIEKLDSHVPKGYNEKKITREERLRMISERNRAKV